MALPHPQVPANSPDHSNRLPRLVSRSKPRTPPASSNPPPETPPLPPPPSLDNWRFLTPSRRILSKHDHELFLASPTFTLITSFIFTLSDSVRDTPVSAVNTANLSPTTAAVLSILDEAEQILGQCPAEDTGGSRFGNAAFRTFLDATERAQEGWHQKLGLSDPAAIEEVSTYLQHSFGNRARIDYGSGHELNFFMWLLCLYQLGRFSPPTPSSPSTGSATPALTTIFQQIVLVLFPRYLRLLRSLQTTYYLEPAGSHGVWGLDDYQFLPFLFGASQLLHHPYIRPKSIHNPLVLEEGAKDYLYLDQVAFVNSVKNVEGLRWHSPMLDDISAARNWGKVEGGMRKMFVAEVLGKLPVMQHFLFGSLIPAMEEMSREEEYGVGREEDEAEGGEGVVMRDGMRHVHAETGWGDCCGIKVPAAVGAQGEMKRMGMAGGLRRVPFD
ncbi:Serine/threonine-protein phosphatase 2A activator 2 [Coniosporium apollinis]|uniref:Serine/threonine-protein phosphatase 2A activator n=1 Tax=Coniosporium apollinis TaxID=61459 RepID=A0ABQ9NUM2_9PEZI|nr:Serine/threonine-protein phosphatase 2A activator 2 [Coniosporium apollinis]